MSPDDGGLSALRFPHDAPPPGGAVLEVAPGVRWLRMPLPFALDHINLWLINDGAGWAIVDTGLNSQATTSLWEHIFAHHLDGRKVTRLIVTHYHPDHIGLAGWLTERLGIEMWITETEWRFGYERSRDQGTDVHPQMAELYWRAGLPEIAETVGIARGSHYRTRVTPVPEQHHRLADGMEIPIGAHRWRVIVGRGHAPEHACLYCDDLGVLIAGDQVLPKISPNVSFAFTELDPDPLRSFLSTLTKLQNSVPAESLVLPSHNLPFFGLHSRLQQLASLHRRRLAEIEAACAAPQTTKDMVPLLFPRALDLHQMGFAIGETLAHLIHSVALGRLKRDERGDGAWLFERV